LNNHLLRRHLFWTSKFWIPNPHWLLVGTLVPTWLICIFVYVDHFANKNYLHLTQQ
jgi:hypothetical protein